MPKQLSERDEVQTAHLRIPQPAAGGLIRLANRNRRSIQSEGLVAIEAHLAAHRVAMKNGDAVPKTKRQQTRK